MDRDKRWERVALAYDLLVHGKGKKATDAAAAVAESYAEGITDEFIKPIAITEDGGDAIGRISEGDVVLFFNFRTDRGRELTEVLSQKALPEFNMEPLKLYFVTLTNYDQTFENIHVVYDKENIEDTLGERSSEAGKSQIRIAETEKYPSDLLFQWR